MSEQIPFPDRLVGWLDIAKGLGEVVFHEIFDRHHHEGLSSHPHDEFDRSSWTPVQQDAAEWIDRLE